VIKIVVNSFLILGISVIGITGCSSAEPKVSVVNENSELYNAPRWVMQPEVEGYVAAVGSASQNAGNDFGYQREEAMADARSNLAKQIALKVDAMFKTYKAATGSGKDATFDKSSSSVSKQIASQTIIGSRIKDTWISKSGSMYVLMVVDTENVANMMEHAVKTSFKNNKAMYQQFLASKAQGELDKELEKSEQ
jgi:hypothetical protein